jgi:hypothetical protein
MDEHGRVAAILKDIGADSWEHPADLRWRDATSPSSMRCCGGCSGSSARSPSAWRSRPTRYASRPKQFPDIYARYVNVLETMDAPEEYPLFISQTPVVNAGAYGMEHPFIVLNSGAIRLLNDEEQIFLLGHELGHVLSGHVLYRTMLVILHPAGQHRLPHRRHRRPRRAPRPCWSGSRKSELSSDRAGLLACQDPTCRARHVPASSPAAVRDEETDLNAFLASRPTSTAPRGDLADSVFKILNLHRDDPPLPHPPRGGAPGLDRVR